MTTTTTEELDGEKAPAGGNAAAGLTFSDVSKRFDDGTLALLPTSFSVQPGELVSIVGPSGCGKSTLLRLAAGLIRPTTGAIALGAGNVGYVFQDPTLLPWRSVRRNVELLGELHGVGKTERRAAADAAIASVGLTGFEDKSYPRRRPGIARVLGPPAEAAAGHGKMFCATSRAEEK